MDVISQASLNITMLDAVARAALGAATCGVSAGGDRSRIHLLNYNRPEQQRASDVLNHFGTLQLSATVSRLTAGDTDPVISIRADMIAGDSALAYLLLRDDVVINRGQVEVVDGEIALRLSDLTAGIHDVFLYRLTGNFASGTARIQVDPA